MSKKFVRLRLENWEKITEEIGDGRKQDEYNDLLKKTNIVAVLFWTKMGKFTKEEFELVKKLRKETGKQLVYIYEKTTNPLEETSESEKETKSIFLQSLQHENELKFHGKFENFVELNFKFKNELDRLFDNGNFKHGNIESIIESVWKFAKRIIGIGLIFASAIMFFFRRDVIFRWKEGDYNSPIQELITPIFILIIGLLIFIFRFKKKW